VEGNMALVALVGTIAASLLEYVTGFLMEAIFHVRYWDYSERPLNLNGYICALSAATWAVFSVFIVSVVNPFVKTYIYMIPLRMADAAAAIFTGFAVVDTGFVAAAPSICARCWNPWSAMPGSCKPCMAGWIPSTSASTA
ncbi:MAG: putative ABC transporter permease, partial [Christensenellales bacterium]